MITRLKLKNFMAFPKLDLEIEPGGILNIKGFNDSGKSALLIALGVVLMNAHATKQKTFIRDGAKSFWVSVTFDDGVEVTKSKFKNGNSVYEMYRDGKLVYTTLAGDKPTSDEGIPEVMASYLKMCVEGDFCLNLRRRTDKMMLVSTSGSENFKLLNEVLKSRELSDAAQLASAKANEVGKQLNEKNFRYRSIQSDLSTLWVTSEFVYNLRKLVERIDTGEEGIQHLGGLAEQLGNLVEVERELSIEIPAEIDPTPVRLLEEFVGVLKEYPAVASFDSLDCTEVNLLSQLVEGISELVHELPAPLISVEPLAQLESVVRDLKSSSDSLESVLDDLGRLKSYFKENNLIYCDNCFTVKEVA